MPKASSNPNLTAEDGDRSFLDSGFMDTDLERKTVPSAEYKIAFIDVFYSADNENEEKRVDKNGHAYCNPLWTITDGNIPDDVDPEMIKSFTDFLSIPQLTDSIGVIKSKMERLQNMLQALNFDPGLTPKEMIEDGYRFLKPIAEQHYECWAKLNLKEDPTYGLQNSISRFTRSA